MALRGADHREPAGPIAGTVSARVRGEGGARVTNASGQIGVAGDIEAAMQETTTTAASSSRNGDESSQIAAAADAAEGGVQVAIRSADEDMAMEDGDVVVGRADESVESSGRVQPGAMQSWTSGREECVSLEEDGKGLDVEMAVSKWDSDQQGEEERYCRICMESIHESELESGEATTLGCACVTGYIHEACAAGYIRSKENRICEVCLEEMACLPHPTTLARAEAAARRQQRRAAVLMLGVNGGGVTVTTEDGDADEGHEAGEHQQGDDEGWWLNRNGFLQWIIWIISRPFYFLYLLIRYLLRIKLLIFATIIFVLLMMFLLQARQRDFRSSN